MIQTPLIAQHVEGHRDRHTPYLQLSRLEQLNKMCDDMANYARTTLWGHPSLLPPLQLPYEITSIWVNQQKVYRNFTSTIMDHCTESNVQTYYQQKYSWSSEDFNNINWDAVHSAMHMCSPSTRTWIGKFACGFFGTAQMMARREKWLECHCPRCGLATESNVHVIQCPNPAARERMILQLTDLYTWMRGMGVGHEFVLEFKRCTPAWLDDTEVDKRDSLSFPFRAQLAIGWTHLIFGRLHLEFVTHVTSIFRTCGVRREGQRFIVLLIHRL